MNTPKIAKGIIGIRKILSENKAGWHIWFDGEYAAYYPETLDQLRHLYPGYILTSVTGNGLTFETPQR